MKSETSVISFRGVHFQRIGVPPGAVDLACHQTDQQDPSGGSNENNPFDSTGVAAGKSRFRTPKKTK
jgi:hypothetical protein